MDNTVHIKKTREIDLVALAMKVLSERALLAKFVIGAAIVGVIVALAKPKAYTAEVILAPEISSGGVGMSESIMDMASSFGIDLGGKSAVDAIYPEIYPTLMSSNEFIMQLLDVPVTLKESNETKTYREHLAKDGRIPFWRYPMIWIGSLLKNKEAGKGNGARIDPFRLTQDEENLINGIRGSVSCVVDKKTSIITIGVTDQDAQVAAILADTLQRRLQAYITDYRTKKARNDVAYYEKLYEECKQSYKTAQRDYTTYADRNTEIVLQTLIARREELRNEMELKYRLYTQVATQLQTAQAKVQERTPAFIIIQGATVPNRASSTPRSFTVILFVILGIGADALWILYGRRLWRARRETKKT